MTNLKAYLIDPDARTITQVEHDGSPEKIYELIDAVTYDTAYTDGLHLHFDDKGLLSGKALVVGADEAEPPVDIKKLKSMVTW